MHAHPGDPTNETAEGELSEGTPRHFLRAWRKFHGKTLEAVAEHIDLTHGQLSRIERGQQQYHQAVLEQLAELYGCHVVDLLAREPVKGRDRGPDNEIMEIWSRIKESDQKQAKRVLLSFTRARL